MPHANITIKSILRGNNEEIEIKIWAETTADVLKFFPVFITTVEETDDLKKLFLGGKCRSNIIQSQKHEIIVRKNLTKILQ